MESQKSTKSSEIITEVTPLSERDCFYIADRHKQEFTFPMHTHVEYELNFIENAAGVLRVVGDSEEVITNYDLTLITSKSLEHVWEQYKCKSKDIHEVTIQFLPELFIQNFLSKNQFITIRKMFEKAKNGLSFPLPAIMRVYSMILSLSSERRGFYAVLQFLSILYELSLFEDSAKLLSSSSFAQVEIKSDSRRIQKAQSYINIHYMEEIRLPEVAKLVNMTPISFSRFFKAHTNKSFSDYLIDIRLGFASRKLLDTTNSVAEIAYDCGYNNLSNFNRVFRKRKNCTPTDFRANYTRNKKLI
ncbi:MAG: AraC family transcriptional regulator [Bacteroidaceae bacterium]